MNITDVAWIRDQRGRPTLELKLDGHLAHIRGRQKSELIRRGLLDGVLFLDSERRDQVPNAYVRGDYAPDYAGLDLVGCTDDPGVFALFEAMCEAIRTGTWHAGMRSRPVGQGSER